VSNRVGWKLPTLQELGSLIDTLQTNPALPSGHPFNVIGAIYWSATTRGTQAWIVSVETGNMATIGQSSPLFVWCVRGGSGVDDQ